MAERYRDAPEYNAYKHGVRIITGPAAWFLGEDNGQPLIEHESEDSITYLDIRDVGEGGLTLREVTKQFDPEESFYYLRMMHLMLDTMVQFRRASVGDTTIEVHGHTILDLDKKAVVALGFRNTTLTMTI